MRSSWAPTHLLSRLLVAIAVAAALGSPSARAQTDSEDARFEVDNETGRVRIDFDDVAITVIIDAISALSGKNFIYDDRVRGKVTVISPSPVTVTEAWAPLLAA